MQAHQVKVVETTIPTKSCIICGKACLPYGFTYNGSYLCQRKCSDTWDNMDAKDKSELHMKRK